MIQGAHDPRATRLVLLLAAGILALALAVAGCGDDTVSPPQEFAPPSNVSFINDNEAITITWDSSPDEARSDFQGYNLYRSTSTLIGATTTELAAAQVTQNPTTVNQLTDAGVTNGTIYYYHVRSVKSNGDLSQASNEVDTAGRLEGGPVTVTEFASAADPSGYDMSAGIAVAMSSTNPDNRMLIDFYLGTTDANDDSGSQLAIKSPHLVLNGDAAWANRTAGFKLLDDRDVSFETPGGWQDQIALGTDAAEINGTVIAVQAPLDVNGERHYGKIEILTSSIGVPGERNIEVLWTFQELPNYIRF